jgi:hypothetical protein
MIKLVSEQRKKVFPGTRNVSADTAVVIYSKKPFSKLGRGLGVQSSVTGEGEIPDKQHGAGRKRTCNGQRISRVVRRRVMTACMRWGAGRWSVGGGTVLSAMNVDVATVMRIGWMDGGFGRSWCQGA